MTLLSDAEADAARALVQAVTANASSALMASLSPSLRDGVLLWNYTAEVLNGGQCQFFSNLTGQYWKETADALRGHGHLLEADILLKVKSVLFGRLAVPFDIDLRDEVISIVSTTAADQDERLAALDKQLFDVIGYGETLRRKAVDLLAHWL